MHLNRKIREFHQFIKGKKVAVMGVGISNRPLIRYIHGLGAQITAFDALPLEDPVLAKTRLEFESQGIHIDWSCGSNYLRSLPDGEFDLIFRTPKMRPDVPEVQKAVAQGAILTSEMEVFMALCPGKIFAVTGSDGKTTTTTLISMILKEACYTVHVGGNIGLPLLDQIEKIAESDMIVLELSSFQLLTMRQSADVAVITNVTPNHLDVHIDYDEYINCKKNIFLNQSFTGQLVINGDNEITSTMAKEARGKVSYFTWNENKELNQEANSGFNHAFIKKDILCYYDASAVGQNHIIEIVPVNDILIPGDHNVANYMAAVCATMPYVKVEDIRQVAKTFGGVEHRIELVRILNHVKYYNSSIDTSPNRTINTMNALKSRHERGVLIAGGADKQCDYTGLGEAILTVCDRIVLCGANSSLIKGILESECAGQAYTVVEVTDYRDAVQEAKELAKPGEIVILSPVGTSYDKFRHFEERGNLFKLLVKEL